MTLAARGAAKVGISLVYPLRAAKNSPAQELLSRP